jgi:hypothetical protein
LVKPTGNDIGRARGSDAGERKGALVGMHINTAGTGGCSRPLAGLAGSTFTYVRQKSAHTARRSS